MVLREPHWALFVHPHYKRKISEHGEMDWKPSDIHRIVMLDACLHHVTFDPVLYTYTTYTVYVRANEHARVQGYSYMLLWLKQVIRAWYGACLHTVERDNYESTFAERLNVVENCKNLASDW